MHIGMFARKTDFCPLCCQPHILILKQGCKKPGKKPIGLINPALKYLLLSVGKTGKKWCVGNPIFSRRGKREMAKGMSVILSKCCILGAILWYLLISSLLNLLHFVHPLFLVASTAITDCSC